MNYLIKILMNMEMKKNLQKYPMKINNLYYMLMIILELLF